LKKGNNMPKADDLKDLSTRLSTIADEVMAASDMEKDELSAHLWILRSVTIRDYAESIASLHERATRQ
jgi:hypothetical protein